MKSTNITNNQGTIVELVIRACRRAIHKIKPLMMTRVSPAALSIAMLVTILILISGRTDAKPNSCQHIGGHIAGFAIPSPDCNAGLIEYGFYYDGDGNQLGTFVACIEELQQRGNGAWQASLAHLYQPYSGGTFTTTDRPVLSPINPPTYRVDNRAIVTGGTGIYENATGFINDNGTFNFQTGELSVDYRGQICTQ